MLVRARSGAGPRRTRSVPWKGVPCAAWKGVPCAAWKRRRTRGRGGAWKRRTMHGVERGGVEPRTVRRRGRRVLRTAYHAPRGKRRRRRARAAGEERLPRRSQAVEGGIACEGSCVCAVRHNGDRPSLLGMDVADGSRRCRRARTRCAAARLPWRAAAMESWTSSTRHSRRRNGARASRSTCFFAAETLRSAVAAADDGTAGSCSHRQRGMRCAGVVAVVVRGSARARRAFEMKPTSSAWRARPSTAI